ncbi:ABC transporter permease [Endozoicomonadaceae bacterium StTr2]
MTRFHPALPFLLIFLLWELATAFALIRPTLLPSPATVFTTLITELASGPLLEDITISLTRLGLGWLTGFSAGLLLGISMGISPALRNTLKPCVSALFAIPKIALLPLFIIWLGIGETAKITTIAFGVFFPTVISVWTGMNTTPQSLLLMARSYQVSPLRQIIYIQLPAALPTVIAGLRISVSLAIVLLVAAEMLGTEHGVGAYILTAGSLVQTDKLIAGVLILAILGLLTGSLINLLEVYLLRNHQLSNS